MGRRVGELERSRRELEALYRADEYLYRHLHLDRVLQALVDVAVDILQADKSGVMVWDEQRERLVARAARGFSPASLARMSYRPGEGVAGRVYLSGEPLVVEDFDRDMSVAREIAGAEGIRSMLSVPITIGERVFGIFGLNYECPRSFTDDDRRLSVALAQRAAPAIENARLYEQARRATTARSFMNEDSRSATQSCRHAGQLLTNGRRRPEIHLFHS